MAKGCTIFDKIWDRHVIAERDDGESLLYIDRLLCQENSFHAFDKLRREERSMRCPRNRRLPFPTTTNMYSLWWFRQGHRLYRSSGLGE